MTNTNNGSAGFSGGVFVFQLFFAPVAIVVFGSLPAVVTDELSKSLLGEQAYVSGLIYFTSFALVGFLAGYGIQRRVPICADSGGRWVWILPLGIFLWAIFDSPGQPLSDFFIPRIGSPAAAIAMWLTFFAIGSSFYSIGVGLATRRTEQLAEEESSGSSLNSSDPL